MATFKISQTQSVQMQQGLRQIVRMQQAGLLQMPDDEFHRLIIEVEQSPFFLRLYRKEKLIHHRRFPRTNISSSFYQFKEEMVADTGSLNIESLLLNKEHIVRQAQKLGLERFKRYFLFPEFGMALEEIAKECDLDVSEVKKINSLIDEFSIMGEFYHPSNFASDVIHYSKVASVDRGEDGFVISYFSPSFARGRYLVNYERFEELNRSGAFSKAEAREARQLFKKLELINSCKDTINRILQNIIKKQALYLESGDSKSLLPYCQKEMAKTIGLAPSSVSRAIRGKSIDTPWSEEVPLGHFFPGPKRFRKELLKQLLETDSGLSSDEAIRAKLWEIFGVAISRRSVANLRKELKFPVARRRKASMGGKKTR
ncbi:hypothetical protein ACFLXX_02890 [Chloroflexota bacterium]